ncbi:TonB-dependent siderophore receptor [Roseateles sp. P5_E11]
MRLRVAGAAQLLVLAAGLAAATGVAASSSSVADLDIGELVQVRLSPFDVAANLDRGYRAAHAVSASRFDAPIHDLPFAIQAFNEQFIRDQKPQGLFDVARYSPGVTYRSNDFNEGNANLAIRGFAVSQVPGAYQVLRDGFVGPSIFDLTSASRIEIVKGPSSFLYGQVAPGGIVNVITKSPRPQPFAEVEVGAGSYGRYRLDADMGTPLRPDLLLRVAASFDQDIHYWRPYDAHATTLAPSLRWTPDRRVSVTLKAEQYSKREAPQLMQKPGYGRQAGLVPTAADPNRAGVDVPGLPDDWNSMSDVDYRRSDSTGASGWVDVEASDHWHLRAGYSRLRFAIDALFSGNLGMSDNQTFLQGRRLRRQTYTNQAETLTADGVGVYRFDRASLRLLLGAQSLRRRFDNTAAQAPNDPALGSRPIASPLPLWDLRDPSTWNRQVDIPLSALTENRADRSLHQTDRSAYAGATLGLLDDDLLLLAGLRYTAARARVDDRITATSQPFSTHELTPQYGALLRLAPEWSLFASFARSFVPVAQVLNRPDGTHAPALPTRGSGWDLGVKAELLNGRATATLTAFDLRNRNAVNDLAQTDSSGNVVIYNVQSGQQRSRGIEFDATLLPAAGWQIYLAYSRTAARILEYSGNDAALLSRDPATLNAAERINYKSAQLLHGARLQMSAPHLFNLWARHDFSGGLYLAGGAHVVRDQTLLPEGPAAARQSYALIDALAGYAWLDGGRRMSIELSGKNLLDRHYHPSQSTRSRPREWLLALKAAW